MTWEIRDPSPGRPENAVGRFFMAALGVAMVLTVLLVLVRPHDANVDYQQAWVVAGLAGSLGLALALTALVRRGRWRTLPPTAPTHRRPSRRVWFLATTTSALGGAAGVLLALPLRYTYGWDAAVVTGFSRELASEGTLSAYAQDYLSRYPNNVPLVALMNLARVGPWESDAQMYNAYLVANGLCLAAVLLICFALVRMLRGSSSAFVAQGVVFLLVGCSPWMAVPYTDFPAMPFVIAAVAMAVAAIRCRRVGLQLALVAAAFASVAIGFVIKSTPASTAAALVVSGIVVCLGRSRHALIRIALVTVVGLLSFGLTVVGTLAAADKAANISRASLDTGRTAPVTWWLANGLTTTPSLSGRPYYGAYNPQMVKESMHLSGERLQQWSLDRLAKQIKAMGPVGIAAFEVRKQGFNWGDGMFFAWGEGYDFDARRLHQHDGFARVLQSVQHPSGAHYIIRASLANGLWLALLLWTSVGLLRSRYRREVLVVVMTVVGIAAFTLLFQGRSRYLFAYVPVIVALAAVVDPLNRVRVPRGAAGQDRGGPSVVE